MLKAKKIKKSRAESTHQTKADSIENANSFELPTSVTTQNQQNLIHFKNHRCSLPITSNVSQKNKQKCLNWLEQNFPTKTERSIYELNNYHNYHNYNDIYSNSNVNNKKSTIYTNNKKNKNNKIKKLNKTHTSKEYLTAKHNNFKTLRFKSNSYSELPKNNNAYDTYATSNVKAPYKDWDGRNHHCTIVDKRVQIRYLLKKLEEKQKYAMTNAATTTTIDPNATAITKTNKTTAKPTKTVSKKLKRHTTSKSFKDPLIKKMSQSNVKTSKYQIKPIFKNTEKQQQQKQTQTQKCDQEQNLQKQQKTQLPMTLHKQMSASEKYYVRNNDNFRNSRTPKVAERQVQPSTLKLIALSTAMSGKVTVIRGLRSYNIDLKRAAKFFGIKFNCRSAVIGVDEVAIEGDVREKLPFVIPKQWPEANDYAILDFGEMPQNEAQALSKHLEL